MGVLAVHCPCARWDAVMLACPGFLVHANARMTPVDIAFMFIEDKYEFAELGIAACTLPRAAVQRSSKHALFIPRSVLLDQRELNKNVPGRII
jgi:hypothetical protein